MTPLIRLRPWRISAAAWYAAAVQDAEILRWTTERAGITATEVRSAISARPRGAQAWLVLDETGRRVGNASVAVHGGVFEPSYWVVPPARGRGVAAAILVELAARAVEAGATHVEVVIAAGNAASQRVAEKACFYPVGPEDHPKLGNSIRYRLGPAAA